VGVRKVGLLDGFGLTALHGSRWLLKQQYFAGPGRSGSVAADRSFQEIRSQRVTMLCFSWAFAPSREFQTLLEVQVEKRNLPQRREGAKGIPPNKGILQVARDALIRRPIRTSGATVAHIDTPSTDVYLNDSQKAIPALVCHFEPKERWSLPASNAITPLFSINSRMVGGGTGIAL
jgi:hypothetical protein